MVYLISVIVIFAIIALPIIAYSIGDEDGYREGYKQGQIDALSGSIEYELRENKDGSKTWEEK